VGGLSWSRQGGWQRRGYGCGPAKGRGRVTWCRELGHGVAAPGIGDIVSSKPSLHAGDEAQAAGGVGCCRSRGKSIYGSTWWAHRHLSWGKVGLDKGVARVSFATVLVDGFCSFPAKRAGNEGF
jgi:hypothetical protein